MAAVRKAPWTAFLVMLFTSSARALVLQHDASKAKSPMDLDTSMMRRTALADNSTAVVRAAMKQTPVYSCDFLTDGSAVGLDGYEICKLNNDVDVANSIATGVAWCAAAGGQLFGNYPQGNTCGGQVLPGTTGGEMYLTSWARSIGGDVLFAGNKHDASWGQCGNDGDMYIGRQCGWTGYTNQCTCNGGPCKVACARGASTLEPTSSPTPSPTPSPTAASAIGDPHLQNVHGERFDLMATGRHILISIPRGERAENTLLLVQARAQRVGGQCEEIYFTEVNVTGSWAYAERAGGYHYDSQGDASETAKWTTLGRVELKVVHAHAASGTKYLNVYVKHLGRAGFAVGGLLGEDDHEAVSTPPAGCAERISLGLSRAQLLYSSDSLAASAAEATLE